MRKPLFAAAMALLAACNSNPGAPATDSTKVKATDSSAAMMRPIQSPYPILYSSSFAMDDPKNAETILALWKAYDAGNLSSVKDLLADTVDVYLAGGMHMRSSRDSTISGIQGFRNTMSAVTDQVNAVMAVKSTDKNEHWVLVWGMEKDTHKNGKVDSVQLQETWRFDGNGKANLLYQFAEKN
ncbi:MAG TPA: hypothetical protein VGS79_07230 [Puia sp.]|nr:hypothetical protein [Puia sp.]